MKGAVLTVDKPTRLTTTKNYDRLNRLSALTHQPSTDAASSLAYQYNAANQRQVMRLADDSYWRYDYDMLGQVVSGRKYWRDGSPVEGQQFEYAFDDIGNRTGTKAGGDTGGAGLRPASYSVNDLNQYTQRDVPGMLDILGVARGTVTVNGSGGVHRQGEYFRKELAVDNSAAAQFPTITIMGEYGSVPHIDTNRFHASVPTTGSTSSLRSPSAHGPQSTSASWWSQPSATPPVSTSSCRPSGVSPVPPPSTPAFGIRPAHPCEA